MPHVPFIVVRRALMTQHASLEEELGELMRVASRADRQSLEEAWAPFERDLLAHLALEEESLFPLLSTLHPDEVRAFRVEHDRIRDVVGVLGLCSDLHTVRNHQLERLIGMLRSHTEREGATLYRWADEQAPVDTRRHLLRLLVDTVRSGGRAQGAGSAAR
jgi:hypothetical protein